MKILVAVKRVIDYNVKVRIRSDAQDVDLNNVKMSMNPFDEIAVEQAIRLKEAGLCNELIAVSIGPQACQETLRTALAMGADKGIHVRTDTVFEPLNIAKILHKVSLAEQPDMILMGKQAIDDDCNQTGQMLAALLNWPQGCFASEIEIQDARVMVTREIDGGLERLSLQLPAVLTADLRLNEPRYVSLPNIMKAKRKPITTHTVEQLSLTLTPRTEVVKITPPPVRTGGIKVNDIDELIEKLRHEAKVIT